MDVGGPTVGYVAVGASAFALLATGPRLLGPSGYSVLAVTWTTSTIVGLGIAFPGEQTITRVLAAGGGSSVVRRVERRLGALAVLSLLLPLLALAGREPLLGGSALWSLSLSLYIAGWAGLASARGRLAGTRGFTSYATTLLVEAGTRIVLCLLAWVVRPWATVLLAAAICLPMIASAASGMRRARHVDRSAPEVGAHSHLREQLLVTVIALVSQIALNSAPLWLQARSGDSVVAGQFVSTTSYLRIPMLLVGGLTAVALSATSNAVGDADPARARSIVRRTLAALLGVAVAATGVLLLLSGPGLRLLYGAGLSIDHATMVVIAMGTVAAMLAGLLTVLTFALHRHGTSATVWVLVALAATCALALAGSTPLGAAAATSAGQALAAAALLVTVAVALRRLVTAAHASSSSA